MISINIISKNTKILKTKNKSKRWEEGHKDRTNQSWEENPLKNVNRYRSRERLSKEKVVSQLKTGNMSSEQRLETPLNIDRNWFAFFTYVVLI